MTSITGKFHVTATPLETDELAKRIGMMRMMFEKSFEGALTAQSTVAMLGLMNQELGSGSYVAIEKVQGSLEGRKGSFCLTHFSSMTRGRPEQSIAIVPDSGTAELLGLSGNMTIAIKNGEHFYTLDYILPPAKV